MILRKIQISLNFSNHGGKLMKVLLKIGYGGKGIYDISSALFKKLEKADKYRKKRWKLKEGCLVLDLFWSSRLPLFSGSECG